MDKTTNRLPEVTGDSADEKLYSERDRIALSRDV
jgi:hypothetical protein